MSKSHRLRLSDVRHAFRILGECRDLGDDVVAWRTHMLEGLRRLLHAQVAVSFEVRCADGAAPIPGKGAVDLGWPSDAAREHFERYKGDGALQQDDTLLNCIKLAQPIATRRREQIVADRVWYRSATFQDYRRPASSDDWIGSVAALEKPAGLHVISLDRPPGETRFLTKERRLLHVFHEELVRLVGTVLSRGPDETEVHLSRRMRQTLSCLLEGDSEKQAALRLGLSRHTVQDLVKALYRRFQVNSRGELLARYVRRRRKNSSP
jgi:DNA-binding CsgD family transcriptional regulator